MATQADRLRGALVDQLLETGMVRTPRVEAALRAVPRHMFVPEVPLRRAYANDVTATKRDADGTPISAASQPSIVAAMLEQLAVAPGHRVLEIGAGTGYNAALLAYLAGDDGRVVTLDVDDDIVDGARAVLSAAGFPGVTVVREDGALGYAPSAPYDRIIATVGARDLPLAWQDQLAPGGRIVVPLRLRGGVTRSIAFERVTGGVLRSVSSEMCGFMPMRKSIASDPRRLVPLTPSGDVLLDVQEEQQAAIEPDALRGVFETGTATLWTGTRFGSMASVEWLYLWLACTLENGLFGMPVKQTAIDGGMVAPMFRWGAMAAVDRDSLAYLTFGPASETGEDTAREVGVVGHGPRGRALAEAVAERVRAWDQKHSSETATFEIWPAEPDDGGTTVPRDNEFTFRTPANVLVITWTRESRILSSNAGIWRNSPV